MGELSILEKIRQWIGDIAWDIFLWGHDYKEEEFIRVMSQQYLEGQNRNESCDTIFEQASKIGK